MKKISIDKALEHFKWKFQNSWSPTARDVEAYNSIVDYKEIQESHNLTLNEPLAKLFIHQLVLLMRTKLYDGETALQRIDEILDLSVYEWSEVLRKEIPMLRFNRVGLDKYPLDENDIFNVSKLQERNEKIIDEFESELTSALNHEVSSEQILKFISKQVTRIIQE